MIDNGLPFEEVIQNQSKWMFDNGFDRENFMFCTVGSWDTMVALPNHLKYLQLKSPNHFSSCCNIKEMHRKIFKEKIHGMNNLLEKYGLKFDGRPHSGIADAYNLARIVQKFYQMGYELKITDRLK